MLVGQNIGLRSSTTAKHALGSGLGLRRHFSAFAHEPGLLAVHVTGTLSPGCSEAFYKHSLQNAKNSVLEDGISRFDVLKKETTSAGTGADDEFLLIEVFKSVQGPVEHKETTHYKEWREAVAPMMAAPRVATKYRTLFPDVDEHWDTKPSAGGIDVDAYTGCEGGDWAASMEDSFAQSTGLFAVVVDMAVLPGQEAAFVEASLRNCRNSIQEPGVSRYDLMQNTDDACNFALVEVYNSADAPLAHKGTAHYAQWAEEVKDMMARPRQAATYRTLFPEPLHWHTSALATHFGDHAADAWSSPLVCGPGLSSVGRGAEVGFSFLSPKVIMGRGIAGAAISAAVKDLRMDKPFVVTGKSGLSRYKELLQAEGCFDMLSACASFSIAGEPTIADAVAAVTAAKAAGADGVVAVGGGSALDLGKAVAALLTNMGTDVDGVLSTAYTYMEGVGEGKSIRVAPVPFVAVPTTSGTGSEATKNAVLKCTTKARKASMRDDAMLPDVAILDPCLTVSCPPDVTAHVGLDTLCQVIEPFTSCFANPIVDALSREGILRAARSLRRVVADGSDLEAREDLSIASLLGGQSLANAKLGAVHGFAAVLGGLFAKSPHGAICAALLPHVFRANTNKLSVLAEGGDAVAAHALARYTQVARMVTGNPSACALDGAVWLEALVRDLKVRCYL